MPWKMDTSSPSRPNAPMSCRIKLVSVVEAAQVYGCGNLRDVAFFVFSLNGALVFIEEVEASHLKPHGRRYCYANTLPAAGWVRDFP